MKQEVECRVLLFLDDNSQNIIKTSVSVFGTYGVKFINSLDEITDDSVEYSKTVVLLEGIMHEPTAMSDLILYKELYELTYVFLGSKKYFEALNQLASCFECDLATLSFDIVQAAVYGDTTKEYKDSKDYFDEKELAERVVSSAEPGVVSDTLTLAKAYLSNADIFNNLSREQIDLQKKLKQLEIENAKLNVENSRLISGYKELIIDTEKFNKSLRRYEQIFSKDVYDKIRLYEFVDRPSVVYIKEFEDFLNIDLLIETIYNTIRLQNRKSVKVVRLFDKVSSRKIQSLPDYYTKFSNNVNMSEVFTTDFISKSGDYRKILKKLLMNDIALDVLIIVDCKDYDDIIISGNATHINLCREYEHLEAFDLQSTDTIFNFAPEGNYVWDRVYETDNLDNNDKFIFLSSQPAVKLVLDRLRCDLEQNRG